MRIDLPLLWVDVETTGLDPVMDDLLEVAFVVTSPGLEVVCEYADLIYPSSYFGIDMPAKVRRMHKESGLLAAIESDIGDRSRIDMEYEIEQRTAVLWDWVDETVEMMSERWPEEMRAGGGVWLAGSKPDFDRGFLEAFHILPSHGFSHRMFDMNTVRVFTGNWAKDKGRVRKHRAMDDLVQDIEELRELLGRR